MKIILTSLGVIHFLNAKFYKGQNKSNPENPYLKVIQEKDCKKTVEKSPKSTTQLTKVEFRDIGALKTKVKSNRFQCNAFYVILSMRWILIYPKKKITDSISHSLVVGRLISRNISPSTFIFFVNVLLPREMKNIIILYFKYCYYYYL